MKIVSLELNDNGEIEVVKQFPSNMMYACNPPRPVPDKVIKDIYKAVDGKIVLDRTIEGKHIPKYVMPEKIEFDETP